MFFAMTARPFAALIILLFVPHLATGFVTIHWSSSFAAVARPAAVATALSASGFGRIASSSRFGTPHHGLVGALRATVRVAESDRIGDSNGNSNSNSNSIRDVNSVDVAGKDFKLNLANSLTLARVAAIPFFMVAFVMRKVLRHRYRHCCSPLAIPSPGNPSRAQKTLGVLIYVASCITDFVDGYVARKYNQMSAFGAFLDPVADKVVMSHPSLVSAHSPAPLAPLADGGNGIDHAGVPAAHVVVRVPRGRRTVPGDWGFCAAGVDGGARQPSIGQGWPLGQGNTRVA